MRLLYLTLLTIALVVVLSHSSSVLAQTKFDSYGRLVTDDEAAHLDLFYVELQKHPNTRGYLIGYNDPSLPPGVFLRRLYGNHAYLTEIRDLDPNRLSVIVGGCREKSTIEMWMGPLNNAPPTLQPNSTCASHPAKRFLFDQECLECMPAVFLDLPGLGLGLRFYAAALREAQGAHALIVVRPGRETSPAQALAAARRARHRLTHQYGLPANRIGIRLVRRRKDNLATAEMWIIPRGAK